MFKIAQIVEKVECIVIALADICSIWHRVYGNVFSSHKSLVLWYLVHVPHHHCYHSLLQCTAFLVDL